ncbi:hypothetical protein ACFFIF_07640 [Vagococcus entomophilus]|uniref:Uncharacterized protein n=1 Tax=Vagococcus entomophilus TaxID=1160095 RepID=A0A430AHV9_9ENTE|nr:hypothetical protein [Vagococcus entomophilus]RSU07357.1 hypothetical protein CBF30_08900 [Vagococcus entomophilus]
MHKLFEKVKYLNYFYKNARYGCVILINFLTIVPPIMLAKVVEEDLPMYTFLVLAILVVLFFHYLTLVVISFISKKLNIRILKYF